MKKVYLTLALGAVSALAFGQAKRTRLTSDMLRPSTQIEAWNPAQAVELPVSNAKSGQPASVNAVPVSQWGVPIGFTNVDVPTTGGTPQRVDAFPDGSLGVAWAFGRRSNFSSRLAGYNYRNAAGQWNVGGTVGYDIEADSSLLQAPTAPIPNTYTGLGSSTARILDPSYLALANGTEVIGGRGTGPAGGFFRGLLLRRATKGTGQWATIANEPNASVRTPFRLTQPQYTRSGNDIHVIGLGYDSTVGGVAVSNADVPFIYARSSDEGATWYACAFPQIHLGNGVSDPSIRYSYNIVAKGNTVAVVGNFRRTYPAIGLATVLLKSNDAGYNWRATIIDNVDTTDQTRTDPSDATLPGLQSVLFNEGAFSIALDQNDNAMITVSRGWDIADSSGTYTGYIYSNGGFANLAAARLMFWSEATPKRPFRQIMDFEDIDKNGNVTFPTSSAPAAPGTYFQGTASQSQMATDQAGNVFVVYSALVETTELYGSGKTTRDIFMLASTDGGRHWSAPINIVGKIGGADDGATGGTADAEESYPAMNRNIGADGKIHLTYYTDDISGSNSYTASYTAANWRPVSIYYQEMTTTQVFNQIIRNDIPENICAGVPVTVNYTLPASITSGTLLFQLDTSAAGNFSPNFTINIGNATVSGATGTITGTIPASININNYAKVRIVVQGAPASTPMAGPYEVIVNSGPALTKPQGLGANPATLTVCKGSTQLFSTSGVTNDAGVEWELTPREAGIVTTGPTNPYRANVWYNPAFQGSTATLSWRSYNGCAVGPDTSVTITFSGPTVSAAGNVLTATGGAAPYRWTYGAEFSTTVGTGATITATRSGTYYVIDANGCRSAWNTGLPVGSIVDGSVTTGVKLEPVLAKSISLYPNPATSQFRVQVQDWSGNMSNVRATVMNQLGQVVAEKALDADGANMAAEFNTAGLSKGLYIVRIVSGTQVATQRVVIQ